MEGATHSLSLNRWFAFVSVRDLAHPSIEIVLLQPAWRKGLVKDCAKRSVSLQMRQTTLYSICNLLPTTDELVCRTAALIQRYLNIDSLTVK